MQHQHPFEETDKYQIKGVNIKLFHVVLHEINRQSCIHTSRDRRSCAFNDGEICILKQAQRIWIFNDLSIEPFTSSNTTFMEGYKEALDYYNNKI